MTVSLEVIASSEQVPVASTLLYTCDPSATYAVIEHSICHNAATTAASLTINVVTSGGSVADSNIYLGPEKILPKKQDGLYGLAGLKLNPGDKIYILASEASSLNLKMSIKEVTE